MKLANVELVLEINDAFTVLDFLMDKFLVLISLWQFHGHKHTVNGWEKGQLSRFEQEKSSFTTHTSRNCDLKFRKFDGICTNNIFCSSTSVSTAYFSYSNDLSSINVVFDNLASPRLTFNVVCLKTFLKHFACLFSPWPMTLPLREEPTQTRPMDSQKALTGWRKHLQQTCSSSTTRACSMLRYPTVASLWRENAASTNFLSSPLSTQYTSTHIALMA